MARLISIQGPTQLLAVLCVLFYQQEVEQSPPQTDILLVGGLYVRQDADVTRSMYRAIRLIAKVWSFERIVFWDESSVAQKYGYDLNILASYLKKKLGISNFNDVYICRTWALFNEVILSIDPNARVVCYGDGYGLLDNNNFFWAPKEKRKLKYDPEVHAYLTIPIDHCESASKCRSVTIVPPFFLKKIVSLAASRCYRHIKQEIERNQFKLAGDITIYFPDKTIVAPGASLVLTANNTESKTTSNLATEIHFYADVCLRYTSPGDTLLIKGHPRETYAQSDLLARHLRQFERKAYSLGAAQVPVELIFPHLRPEKVIAISPSSSVSLAFLYQNFDLVIGSGSQAINRYFEEKMRKWSKINDALYKDLVQQAVSGQFQMTSTDSFSESSCPDYAYRIRVEHDDLVERCLLPNQKQSLELVRTFHNALSASINWIAKSRDRVASESALMNEFLSITSPENHLNLGCGSCFHPDWTNVDFKSTGQGVIPYDLTQGIPFPDNSFTVVYHSHLLEHLPKSAAEPFLRDCYRVLQPGGILRVVVPDLEQIARLYLTALEKASQGDREWAANYDWMLLEMYDQVVRDRSGGEMAAYLSQDPLPNEAFVLGRLGAEGERMLNKLRDRGRTAATNNSPTPEQVGEFRRCGEIHQWMYDRHSLGVLLAQAGFRDIRVTSALESRIPGFGQYHLDTTPEGKIRKADSLFMEAGK